MAIWQRSARRTPAAPDPTPGVPPVTATAPVGSPAGPTTAQAVADHPEVRHDPADLHGPPGPDRSEPTTRGLGRRLLDSWPVTLVVAAHPAQAVVTAAGVAVAAAASGRPAREVAVVLGTVLVGQAVLGWHNDVVDRDRDVEHHARRKPVADGRLDVGTVWFAVVVALLLVVPMSLSTGVTAGVYYLVSILLGIVSNVALREGRFSWVLWAASFAMLPFYLSWGGWGGSAENRPPQVAVVVVAALLGVGVHALRAVYGLVADEQDGWTYYPLRLGRRLGATRLLVLSGSWCALMVVALAVLGATVGLRR